MVASESTPLPDSTPPANATEGSPPPSRWLRFVALLVPISIGICAGIGVFTFGYGKGASYLSDNPNSCANCHVMQDHLDSWQKSSHHHVATCNDCHLSHSTVGKWWTKADNGFFHSLAFTFGNYHQPIQIKPRNRTVTQQSCLHCHEQLTASIMTNHHAKAGDVSCVHCHSSVGHAFRPFSSNSRRD